MVGRVPGFGLQSLSYRPSTRLGEEEGPMAHSLQRSGSKAVTERGVGNHLPLMGEQVKLPVQLAHCDGLGVEHIVSDSLIHATTDGRLPFQRHHGSC